MRPLTLGLWLAQGFGIGRVPKAPGTAGSVLGLLLVAALLAFRNPWFYALGTLAGLALSVWLCGIGERALGTKDPGSVVLDEITALPVCFLASIGLRWSKTGTFPGCLDFFAGSNWPTLAAGFLAFRFFDILKPWPIRQSQRLPGGWGVTVDDFLAALYVNLALLLGNTLASAILPLSR
jgi:phosphatidylglycerophosphatase A